MTKRGFIVLGKFVCLSVVLIAWLVAVSPAYCAIDVVGVVFSMIDLEAVAALILAALAGVWIIRKVLILVQSSGEGVVASWQEYRVASEFDRDDLIMDDYVDDTYESFEDTNDVYNKRM